ncbi:glycosyltransferase involved in cell wall biosynthesis [Bacillus tianshenii]|uniref:Glycosyltransferase involved in cell wall biosynthesis n=1 Tax=Sutcliffiella tianshenii TaxID=1463404 RepID=A0ABS2NUD5_9BACI|nr:glycosyltransferase [Bacillus tianshenii]MBM7618266.1 glycosyltransferase involved in cell wall biosynthesis [Bacillus tianshenii]
MKKKVLFMVINMNIGGTEKALLNMINEMPKDQYDITVLMLEEYGGFLAHIPEWVNIQHFNGYKKIKGTLNNPSTQTIKEAVKNKMFLNAFFLFVLSLISKITGERSALFNYLLKKYPIDPTEYDVAIAYAGPMDFISYFVIEKIKAKKKVQWIHFDITKIGFNLKFVNRYYKKFDNIFSVSKTGKTQLESKLPKLKGKINYFYNILSTKQINMLANKELGFEDTFNGLRILTVGRLNKEKGQDLCIPVLSKLIKEGYNLKWYCIGEGSARSEYEKLIHQYGLQDDFLLLGASENPYPFFKQCDIYVQPSRHEGFCITLAEARCFNKPIIATNFNGAADQICNEHNGLIVDSNEFELFKAIKRLIVDEALLEKFQRNLKGEFKNNHLELNKLEIVIKN